MKCDRHKLDLGDITTVLNLAAKLASPYFADEFIKWYSDEGIKSELGRATPGGKLQKRGKRTLSVCRRQGVG